MYVTVERSGELTTGQLICVPLEEAKRYPDVSFADLRPVRVCVAVDSTRFKHSFLQLLNESVRRW